MWRNGVVSESSCRGHFCGLFRLPGLNTASSRCKDLVFHFIQQVLIAGRCSAPKVEMGGGETVRVDRAVMCKCLWVCLSSFQNLQASRQTRHLQAHVLTLSASSPLFVLSFSPLPRSPKPLFLHTHPSTGPRISRLRKQHSMFLSFPWPLVPEPFEEGSIPNINVCCSLVTAPLVGDEADNQTVKLPSLLASFPLSYLTLLLSIFIFLCDRSDT